MEFTIKLEDTDAASAVFTLRSNYKGGAPEAYRLIADQIEAQIPAVDEPQEFASVVKATTNVEPSYGKPGLLWVKITDGWVDDVAGICRQWRDLDITEVLRVGLGGKEIEDAYGRGYEDGAESNLPSPVDRSNINSALREAIAKISLREGRLIGEGHSYELTDAVMKSMVGRLDASYDAGFHDGRRAMNTQTHVGITALREEAITSERKSGLDKALQLVEELAP